MSTFDLSQSRLNALLLGMRREDAREFMWMAATMQALHENTHRALEAYDHAR